MKIKLFYSIFFIFGIVRITFGNYTVSITVKHPFLTSPHYYYDSLTKSTIVVSDSFARFIPVRLIIYHIADESLYQDQRTNEFGYARFNFDSWSNGNSVSAENISRVAVNFPNTARVSKINGEIVFGRNSGSNLYILH